MKKLILILAMINFSSCGSMKNAAQGFKFVFMTPAAEQEKLIGSTYRSRH